MSSFPFPHLLGQRCVPRHVAVTSLLLLDSICILLAACHSLLQKLLEPRVKACETEREKELSVCAYVGLADRFVVFVRVGFAVEPGRGGSRSCFFRRRNARSMRSWNGPTSARAPCDSPRRRRSCLLRLPLDPPSRHFCRRRQPHRRQELSVGSHVSQALLLVRRACCLVVKQRVHAEQAQ